jgi:hypothetical protein
MFCCKSAEGYEKKADEVFAHAKERERVSGASLLVGELEEQPGGAT